MSAISKSVMIELAKNAGRMDERKGLRREVL